MRLQRTKEYKTWIRKLKDRQAAQKISFHIRRMEIAGQLLGDYKSVGDGVIEIRFHFGKGYRVYCYEEKGTLLLLLAGGDKSTQAKDIEKAKDLLKGWER